MREKRLTIFRLLGFDVKLHLSWAAIALLVAWSLAKGYFPFVYPGLSVPIYWWMAASAALGLFLSIVIHELAQFRRCQKVWHPHQGHHSVHFRGRS